MGIVGECHLIATLDGRSAVEQYAVSDMSTHGVVALQTHGVAHQTHVSQVDLVPNLKQRVS